MKPLIPRHTIDLQHKFNWMHGSPDGSRVVAASWSGEATWIDSSLGTTECRRLANKLEWLSVHPTERWVAYSEPAGGSLAIEEFGGPPVARLAAVAPSANARPNWKPTFGSCLFNLTGDLLWTVAAASHTECEVALWDTRGWSPVAKYTFPDPYGDSFWWLSSTPDPDLTCLWIAAGQDGQQVRWLRWRGGKIGEERFDKLANCTPPAFSPGGSELLVLGEDSVLCRMSFPGLEMLGELAGENEDDPFAESMCYVSDRQALAASNEGRIYLIDTQAMAIADEIGVAGHEPRPIGVYYPTLAAEGGIATDLACFTRFGETVMFVFRGSGSDEATHSLAIWSLRDVRVL
jgi:hypothetical protein